MINETVVTLQGWLGSDVRLREAGDSVVADFRVGCTPRRFSRKTQQWVDGDTQWYTVNAWRTLGEHCAASLRRGDAVVVHGKLSAHTWTTNAGTDITTFEVEASLVGHDLNRGTTTFTKKPRQASAAEIAADQPVGTQPAPDAAGLTGSDTAAA